jgi:hypothetical protein
VLRLPAPSLSPTNVVPGIPGPSAPPGEENPGRVKYRLDAKAYAGLIELGWLSRVQRIMAYPPAGDRYAKAGYATIGYHDAFTSWGPNGLNPTHRAEYAAIVSRDREVGYAGTFMDDIEWNPGYHLAGSRAEVANLVQAARSALGPAGILELNSQWSDLWPRMKEGDPDVARALAATNVVDKEFGVSPSSGINSAPQYAEFVAYVGALHAKHVHIDLVSAAPGDEYSLATYFLLNDGGDFIGAKVEPSTWWRGFELNLGPATSAPTRSPSGVWSRSFSGGQVYVLEPGATTQTISFGPHHTIAGAAVSEATLEARHGIVLLP